MKDSSTPSAEQAQVTFTRFADVNGKKATRFSEDWEAIVERIRRPRRYPAKNRMPLIKLAAFGDAPKEETGCLRHDGNLLEITGIEGDYDGGKMPIEEAAGRLADRGIEAALYTTPSHTPEAPRWRALLPLSRQYPPERRAEFVDRLNGVLGGVLAPESWTLSQAFYIGALKSAPYTMQQVRGRCIDLVDELPKIPRPARSSAGGGAAADGKIGAGGRNHALTSLAGTMRRRGMSCEAIEAALLAENIKSCDPPLPAAEVQTIARSISRYPPGERSQVNGDRELDIDEIAGSSAQSPAEPDHISTELDAQIDATLSNPPAVATTIADDLAGLIPLSGSNSTPVNCEANAIRIMRALPIFGDVFFDTFDQRIKIDRAGTIRAWQDEDDTRAAALIQQAIAPRMTVNIVRAAINVIARERSRDSLLEFLDSLPPWDGVPRIDRFFPDVTEAEDTEHHRAAGRNLLIAMISRAKRPGCEVHFAVILESNVQGTGKNNLFKALCGDYYTEARAAIDKTDFLRLLRSNWLVHMGELGSIKKAEIETVKDRIAASSDEYRELYERHTRRYPRRCVIVGSTNKDKYLSDETGNRRFIPVKCGKGAIRTDLVAANRLQYFAEALQRFNAGEPWHLWPAETTGEQADRVFHDAWHDKIAAWVEQREEVTVYDVLAYALGVDVKDFDRARQTRVGCILRQLGWGSVRRDRLASGSRTGVYRRFG